MFKLDKLSLENLLKLKESVSLEILKRTKKFTIYCDASSKGNPGPSGIAYIIKNNSDVLIKKSKFIGNHTNNQAEYLAIYYSLSELKNIIRDNSKTSLVTVYLDSQLAINQIQGSYLVKDKSLFELLKKILKIMKDFKEVKLEYCNEDYEDFKIVDKMSKKCLNF